MKTSVNMIRKMGTFKVTQRTKDSYFNATLLAKQWRESTGQRKDVSDFLRLDSTKEYASAIQNDTETREIPYLKKRGKYGGTWMHPYLFIDFAMWLNPNFKLKVIKFVYDQLIEYRNNAGDLYKGFTNAASKFPDVNYSQLAKGLNYIVFGHHERGIRQKATPEQLEELNDIQKQLAFAIDMNLIKSYQELIAKMRELYASRQLSF